MAAGIQPSSAGTQAHGRGRDGILWGGEGDSVNETSDIQVVVIVAVADEVLSRIAAIDPRLRVIDARGWFDDEIAESWPAWTAQRYLSRRPVRLRERSAQTSREERDRVLARADVIVGGFPFPLDLRARAPRLRWFHQLPAGASNLRRGDLWGSDVIVTSSRGWGDTRPMAEYVLAAFLHFARGFHAAYRDRRRHSFEHRSYRPLLLKDKTVCVIGGAGGIGKEVGSLCAGVGMRVVGTRRTITPGEAPPPGFALMESEDRLHSLLAQSDFVAVCCQWTPQTTGLVGREAIAAMKPEAVLVNVARGEIIDEEALIAALDEGKLRGVALDVYAGEFEHEPDRRLWDNDRVLITPHLSGGSDIRRHRGLDLFCDNLRAFLDGRPLVNVVDWQVGY